MKMIKHEEKSGQPSKVMSREPVNPNSIEGMTIDTDVKVKGTFMNIESPGQNAKITAKLYKGMAMFSKLFDDNESAIIPLSVARFINERCYHEKHSHVLDEKGNPSKTGKNVFRYKFIIESYV